VDLLPHLPGIKLDNYIASLKRVNPNPKYFAVSAVNGQGLDEWASWLQEKKTHA
jgi:Ni2+-binding GTPase involved in maturation of urease and hydrogenase